MKSSNPNPVRILNAKVEEISRRNFLLLELLYPLSVGPNEDICAKLEPGLIILQAELERHFPVDRSTPFSKWMDIFETFDSDTEWLEEMSEALSGRLPELSRRLQSIADGYAQLMPLAFAAWLWAQAADGCGNDGAVEPSNFRSEQQLAA